MRTITDNWLIQDAAIVLTGTGDPLAEADYIDVVNGVITAKQTLAGAVGILCLAHLIEQIILCSDIGVIDNWSEAWRGVRGFGPVLEEKIVQFHAFDEDDTRKSEYLDELMRNASFAPGVVNESWYATTVTRGSARYLALAEFAGRPYVPHPFRARFLTQTVWRSTPGGAEAVEALVNSARIKLHRIARPTSTLTQLMCNIPAFALLCLRESSVSGKSPLEVALEIRREDSVKVFRDDVDIVETALRTDDAATLIKAMATFETAVLEVERRLRLRQHAEIDGPATVSVVDLPVRIPTSLHRPTRVPKHTGVVRRLVTTGMYDLSEVVARSLGIRSARVINALAEIS